MMATNRIRIDLSSNNNNIVGLVLCVLSEICTSELARDLHLDVLKVNLRLGSAWAAVLLISERKRFLRRLRLSKKCQTTSLSFCLKFQPVLKKKVMECFSVAWPFWKTSFKLTSPLPTIWLSWFLKLPRLTDWLHRNTTLSMKSVECKIPFYKWQSSSS
jgi:hypothetical protein